MTTRAAWFPGYTPEQEPITFQVPKSRHRCELAAAMAAVVEAHGIGEEDIRGGCRYRRAVLARHTVWRLLRERGWSLSEIGREFGRDHTTVKAACDKGAGP